MSIQDPEIRLALSQGNYDQARALLQTALSSDPSADTYYFASLTATDPNQRQAFLQQALALNPNHSEARAALYPEQGLPQQSYTTPSYQSAAAQSYGAPNAAQPTNSSRDTQAIAGLVLGIIMLGAWFIPLCGVPFGIAAIAFSSLGLRSSSKRTMAIIGLSLGIIGMILTLANAALGVYIALNGGL